MTGKVSIPDDDVTAVQEDAVDRFERMLDLQSDLLSELDTKAEHVTRLVGVILGVILTAFSVAFRTGEGVVEPTVPTALTFGIGTAGLVLTLVLGTITYLSSRLKLGLHPDTSYALQGGNLPPEAYPRLVLNSYASAIEENRDVLQVNANRLRMTLTTLMGGVAFLAIAVLQYVALPSNASRWVAFLVGTIVIAAVSTYVLTGRYLTLDAY